VRKKQQRQNQRCSGELRFRIARLLWCFSLKQALRGPIAKYDLFLFRVGVSDALALAARNSAYPFRPSQPCPLVLLHCRRQNKSNAHQLWDVNMTFDIAGRGILWRIGDCGFLI